MNEKVNYWIDLASYDLETAYAMLQSSRFLYVGFMCHQTVEKILKGYYVYEKKETAPYTHNLTFLAEKSGLFQLMSDSHKDLLDLLGPLNIQARYPTYKEKLMKSLSEKRCEEIVKETEGFYQWIRQQLLNV